MGNFENFDFEIKMFVNVRPGRYVFRISSSTSLSHNLFWIFRHLCQKLTSAIFELIPRIFENYSKILFCWFLAAEVIFGNISRIAEIWPFLGHLKNVNLQPKLQKSRSGTIYKLCFSNQLPISFVDLLGNFAKSSIFQ